MAHMALATLATPATPATHTAHTAPVVPIAIEPSDITYILTLPEKEQVSALCGLLDDGKLPSYDAISMVL